MLGRVWEFIKRHKKKFVFAGVVIIGSGYVYRYMRRKLKDFQDKEAAECLKDARRQHHFDSNQRTCNMTVLSLLPTLREKLLEILNTEVLTEQLKSSPANKLQLWEDLKVISFTRVICLVYSCTMMCMMLRVQLNIIGGFMYIDNIVKKNGLSKGPLHITPTDVQENYLSLIRGFFDKGLPDLVTKVQEAVLKETGSLTLKERLSLGNVESVLKHIRERVENGGECSLKEISTLPLSQYLLNPDQIAESSNPEDLYAKLLLETHDILESSDFHQVFGLCLNRGFSKLIDCVADNYKQFQRKECPTSNLHEVAIPLAKLIPYVSGLFKKLSCDAPNPLVQELLLIEQTKTLARNIYEAFSQSEDIEDLETDVQFQP